MMSGLCQLRNSLTNAFSGRFKYESLAHVQESVLICEAAKT